MTIIPDFLKRLDAEDIFISYARSDGSGYVRGLVAALSKRKFACFTDQHGTDAGKKLPWSLRRKIRICKTLVLVASRGALKRSANLSEELAEFAKANGTARILCVEFGTARRTDWSDVGWNPYLEGKVGALEPEETLTSGRPSDWVVAAIADAATYMKSQDRLRMYRNRALVGFLALLLAGTATGLFAMVTFSVGRRQAAVSEARALAERSGTLLRQRPDDILDGVRLAAGAMDRSVAVGVHAVEADAALRDALRLLPRRRASTMFADGDTEVAAEALSPDGRHVALVTDGRARVYDARATAPLAPRAPLREFPCACWSIALSSDLRVAAARDEAGLALFDLTEEKVRRTDLGPQAAGEGFALSPDGHYLAVYSPEGESDGRWSVIRILDLPDGREIAIVRDPSMQITDVAFGASGNLAVAGHLAMPREGLFDGRVVLWNVADAVTRHELTDVELATRRDISLPRRVSAVAPGSDTTSFVTDRTLWRATDVAPGPEAVAWFPYTRDGASNDEVDHVAIAADGATVTLLRTITARDQAANEHEKRALEVWDTSGYGAVGDVLIPPEFEAYGVSFDPTGARVATIGEHGVQVFPRAGGAAMDFPVDTPDATEQPPDRFDIIDGFRVHVTGRTVIVRDLWGGRKTTVSIPSPLERVTLASVGAGGASLALTGPDTDGVQHAVVYRRHGDAYVEWKRITQSDDDLTDPVAMSLSADGHRLAMRYAYADWLLRLWDVEGGRDITPSALRDLDDVNRMLLSPGGRFLAISDADFRTSLVEFATWRTPIPIPLLEAAEVETLRFSAGDRYLGIGTSDGTLHVFDTSAPDGTTQIARLLHRGQVRAAAFSPDGRFVAVASTDRRPYGLELDRSFPMQVWALQPADLLAEARSRLDAAGLVSPAPASR